MANLSSGEIIIISDNTIDSPGPGTYKMNECTPRGRYTIVGGNFGGRPRSREFI